MTHSVLIIDDEKDIPKELKKVFNLERPNINVYIASEEEEIMRKIENLYYNIAIVDLRMDEFKIDGIDIIEKILDVNPFAKIIVMSGYLPSFKEGLNIIKKSGKIIDIIDKLDENFIDKIFEASDNIISEYEKNPSLNQKLLERLYADALMEEDNNLKGSKFEQFTNTLFSQMGFTHISKRNKDKSLNEVDLIIRNEINDLFFQKLSPYILVECKNTNKKVGKNDFIQFYSKLENTNGLSNFGVLITSNTIARTTYIEAVRTAKQKEKIIFIDRKEIKKLIETDNKLDLFKQIIDQQVKDN